MTAVPFITASLYKLVLMADILKRVEQGELSLDDPVTLRHELFLDGDDGDTYFTSEDIGGTAGGWISMFNLSNIPVHVNDVIFGEPSEITEDAPARILGSARLVGWWALWTVGPALWLWRRYRRLTP